MTTADNKMKALELRLCKLFKLTGLLISQSEKDTSADKVFTSFLLVELAKEHGLLNDNCNRAVAIALHAVGIQSEETPS